MAHDTLPDRPHELFEWLAALLLAKYREASDSRTNIIAVLGAGSSMWSGLPTWDSQFKERLIHEASKVLPFFTEECWRKLGGTIGLPPDGEGEQRKKLIELASIEDIAAVAMESAVASDRVYELLMATFTPYDAKLGDKLQPPQLGYELISHFLKHGFIDHIVTFNFDELLDEAVDNELGRNEIVYVASDQDVSERAHKPLPHLIKLHGTLSRRGTLRFTPTTTNALPPATIALLDRVVFGRAFADKHEETRRLDTYIVSLGYGWRDADIKHWLDARRDLVKGLLIVSKGDDCNRLRNAFSLKKDDKDRRVSVLNIDDLCKLPPDKLTIDPFLWALCSELESRMVAEHVPFMPASRHVLLSYLFTPKRLVDRSRSKVLGEPEQTRRTNEHEALYRFVVEFVLHLAKCKGMVNLSTMAGNERIGRYYSLVKNRYSDLSREKNIDLLSLMTANGFISRFRHRTGEDPRGKLTVQPSTYPDVKETYYALAKTPEQLADPLLSENEFAVAATDRPFYDHNEKHIVPIPGGDGHRFVKEQITAIFNGPEIEVGRRTPDRESWTLPAAEQIPTYIDLQNRTSKVLRDPWTDLWLIAESGDWLTKMNIETIICERQPRRIILIDADQPSKDDWPLRNEIAKSLEATWERYRQRGVEVSVVSLPWWQHNRHMTLAFDKTGGRATCTGGIFFRRRHKKSRIQPLAVDPGNADDVAELMLTFLAYLGRAGNERRRNGFVPFVPPAVLHMCKEIADAMEHPQIVQSRMKQVFEQLQELAGEPRPPGNE